MNYWATKEIKTFDAEGYINEVFEKYTGTVNEESRENLQRQWDATLSMPRGGDASLYPNAHGPRPALLDVWHKAGDFWRAGYRRGDVLYCDQHGFPLEDWMFEKIRQAKGEDVMTDETPAQATETPQDAQSDASETIIQPASDTPTEATETPADNEPTTTSGIVTALKGIANNKTASELAKGVGILAAVLIIYKCGLLIPFALLGGLAGGFIK